MIFQRGSGPPVPLWIRAYYEQSLPLEVSKSIPEHARIQEFSSGGGVQVSLTKKALTRFFFFFFFFFSPQLILQKSNGQFQRNLSFFKVPEGVQHFPGGVQLLPGGGGGPIAYSL